MAKTSQLEAIARVAPLLRGLLAEPTGNDDQLFRPMILKNISSGKSPCAGLQLEPARKNETDEEFRVRLAAALPKSKPKFIALPGVGEFQVVKPKSKLGHDPRLAGRTTLVTGAAGAIGYGI